MCKADVSWVDTINQMPGGYKWTVSRKNMDNLSSPVGVLQDNSLMIVLENDKILNKQPWLVRSTFNIRVLYSVVFHFQIKCWSLQLMYTQNKVKERHTPTNTPSRPSHLFSLHLWPHEGYCLCPPLRSIVSLNITASETWCFLNVPPKCSSQTIELHSLAMSSLANLLKLCKSCKSYLCRVTALHTQSGFTKQRFQVRKLKRNLHHKLCLNLPSLITALRLTALFWLF